MTTKKALTLGLIAISAFTFTFISCKKDSDNKAGDIESSENNSLAETHYNDAATMIDLAITNGSNMQFKVDGEESLLSGCVTVTLDTVSATRTVVIDFGTANCLCVDGRNRRGRVLASFTGKYRDQGTVISVSFDNYFVNDNQIKGTKTITNAGTNGQGQPVYNISVAGSIVKANNGGTITWNSTRQRTWTAGYNTLTPLDDEYAITGSASGTNADETAYTIEITTPLVHKNTCRWFESGVLAVTPQGKSTRTLDYGNTGCDANATVTISGITFNVVLP